MIGYMLDSHARTVHADPGCRYLDGVGESYLLKIPDLKPPSPGVQRVFIPFLHAGYMRLVNRSVGYCKICWRKSLLR